MATAQTPSMASLKPLENTSPAGAFVSVFTPTDANAVPTTEDVDINGIKLGAWAAPLEHSHCELKSAYFWTVCCCPCVPVAQLEVRLGWASYKSALLRHAFSYGVMVAFAIANVYALACVFQGEPAVWAELALLVGLLATAVLVSRRIAKMRTEVRERFQIEGTVKDDQYVALMHSGRAIRQMGKHLQCDRAYFRGAPTTLQAYQV